MVEGSFSDIGYVYIIDCGDLVKIGKSINPGQRTQDILAISGLLRKHVSCRHMFYQKTESTLHKQFAERRVKGEWFDISFQVAKKALDDLGLQEVTESEIETSKETEEADLDHIVDRFYMNPKNLISDEWLQSKLDRFTPGAILQVVKLGPLLKAAIDIESMDGYDNEACTAYQFYVMGLISALPPSDVTDIVKLVYELKDDGYFDCSIDYSDGSFDRSIVDLYNSRTKLFG